MLGVKVGFTVYPTSPDDDTNHAPLNFVTDYFSMDYVEKLEEITAKMLSEAKKYIAGERAQGELELEESDKNA